MKRLAILHPVKTRGLKLKTQGFRGIVINKNPLITIKRCSQNGPSAILMG